MADKKPSKSSSSSSSGSKPRKKTSTAAKKPAAPTAPTAEEKALADYQNLYRLRKAMAAAKEDVAAANRNLARASGLNTIAHRVAAEDQALARLNDARARYHEAYVAFNTAKASA